MHVVELIYQLNGMWRSLVAHFVRDEGAVGSNPAIPILWIVDQIRCNSSVGCVIGA